MDNHSTKIVLESFINNSSFLMTENRFLTLGDNLRTQSAVLRFKQYCKSKIFKNLFK